MKKNEFKEEKKLTAFLFECFMCLGCSKKKKKVIDLLSCWSIGKKSTKPLSKDLLGKKLTANFMSDPPLTAVKFFNKPTIQIPFPASDPQLTEASRKKQLNERKIKQFSVTFQLKPFVFPGNLIN